MGIYLDSADLDHARRARALGFVQGVTTNPILIARTGRPGLDVLGDLLELGDGVAVMRQVAAVVKDTPTRPMAASLKSTDEVVAAILAGARDVAIPLDLIRALGDHPLSEQAIAEFAAARAG